MAGGKGLEHQSCWWDKATVPWKTKNIFEIALTDNGYVIRDLDPGVPEYTQQKMSELPISSLRVGPEIGEAEFLEATAQLRTWSDNHKCRFFVRVFDETGPSAKAVFKTRIDALETRFYKELTNRRFYEGKP